MAERCDVIVIGLGPAGAAAATALARAGAKVLVLNGAPARAKPCGGCLSRWAVDQMAWLDPPGWLLDHPVGRLRLAAPGRVTGDFPTRPAGAFFVDRARFDAFLARRATEAKASVVAASARKVSWVHGGYEVTSDAGVWRSDWLVGADGAASLTARRLGMRRSSFAFTALVQERTATLREVARLRDSALLDIGAAPGGYGWAFLRGEVLNLGLAGRGIGTKELVERYAGFMQRHHLGSPGAWRGGVIPCPDGGGVRRVQGRALLVGDAACLADPFLGEGVGQAVFSGQLAARAILAGDTRVYLTGLRDTLLADARSARFVARVVYGAPGWWQHMARRHPGSVELEWQLLRGELRHQDLLKQITAKVSAKALCLDLPSWGRYSKYLN